MSVEVRIDKMSVPEKLQLMEMLWDDLSRRPEDVPSPAWHGEMLDQRRQAVREGRTSFEDWEDAKQRLRARFE